MSMRARGIGLAARALAPRAPPSRAANPANFLLLLLAYPGADDQAGLIGLAPPVAQEPGGGGDEGNGEERERVRPLFVLFFGCAQQELARLALGGASSHAPVLVLQLKRGHGWFGEGMRAGVWTPVICAQSVLFP